MITAIIIDDEEDARVILASYLHDYCPDVKILTEADSVETGIQVLKSYAPQLVFLDVCLVQGSSFDILKAFEHIDFDIIFTTAHNEYAIKAIRFSALDYLLKPLDVRELIQAVNKAKEKRSSEKSLQFQIFKENMTDFHGGHHRIIVPTVQGFIVISTQEIIYCKADSNYCQFILTEGNPILASKTLRTYEEILNGSGFVRPHKSFLVNMAHIKSFKKRKKGGVIITSNHKEIPLSINRKQDFLQRFLVGNVL